MDVVKGPDKYKCIKLRFNKIINNTNTYNNKNILETISNAVIRTNKIAIKSYMLLRLWVLKKYESNTDIPKITKDVIRMSFNAVMISKGKKPKGDNALLLTELQNLYKSDINSTFENGIKLSTILNYYSTTILTSIENNIKNNFINYINRYIKSFFFVKYEKEITCKEFKKQLIKDINVIKKDLHENTIKCDNKYKEWLIENRNKIVPVFKGNNIYKLLNDNPQDFIKHMIYINKEIAKLGKKQYQFFPLQNNTVLKHVQIDTGALIELFATKVSEIKKDIDIAKAIIWTGIFNINQTIKNYVFDYTIITDGFSTALRFLHKDKVEEEKLKHKKKKEGRKKRNDRLRGLGKEDKLKEEELIKKESIELKNSIKLQKELTYKINKDKKEQEKKEKQEKASDKEKESSKDNTNEPIFKYEFPYIDDVSKEDLKGKHIFIDPGKRSLLTMVDDNNKYLNYTNSEYLNRTKRLIYAKKIENYKTVMGITIIERELVNFNSKSCIVEDFIKYIKKKLEVNNKILDRYNDIKFRKYKWYSYINKKRTEDNLLNTIENTYSKDHIIIIGDWSIGKQMANFISTPNLTLKRKLRERFTVYNIDEFRTSCINYKTEKKGDNLWLPSTNGKQYKKHSILTYKMENKRLGCINRDKNGCQNIKKLFISYMTSGTIPKVYRRDYILN
uniref:Uncharacterized protein n=1 Tax=viral metagenome TaxID=1070528 RepID=A0A6C0HMC7_9ZZZZ